MSKQARVIIDNWRQEMEAAHTYQLLAQAEQDERRRELFQEMADMERRHAAKWEARMRDLGISPPAPPSGVKSRWRGFLARHLGPVRTLEGIERDERHHARKFAGQIAASDPVDGALLAEIAHDEEALARKLHYALAATREQGELDTILHRERWHVRSGGWVADAVYGANDGLGAVFGIVSGMAGYTRSGEASGSIVLVAGLAGMLASALSMGSSAYLAAKSEREVIEAELARERAEIEEEPEEEKREMELFYKLKGFSDAEAEVLVNRITASPEDMLSTMAHEELGISHASAPNPWASMVSATLATAAGAAVPLIPFFFTTGMPAVIIALVISLIAHFLVGVLKSLLTTRNWFASGMEMTLVGVIVSVATYLLGVLLSPTGLT